MSVLVESEVEGGVCAVDHAVDGSASRHGGLETGLVRLRGREGMRGRLREGI